MEVASTNGAERPARLKSYALTNKLIKTVLYLVCR